MREIKFRAWSDEAKKIISSRDFWISADGYSSHFNEHGIIEYNHHKLMQYTGLKDKNCVNIYEGDVIQIEKDIIGITLFIEGRFEVQCISRKYGYFDVGNCSEIFEVIGNIYENKDLL